MQLQGHETSIEYFSFEPRYVKVPPQRMISQYVYISDIARGQNPCGVSYSKENIAFFEAESAIFYIPVDYLKPKNTICFAKSFDLQRKMLSGIIITPTNYIIKLFICKEVVIYLAPLGVIFLLTQK